MKRGRAGCGAVAEWVLRSPDAVRPGPPATLRRVVGALAAHGGVRRGFLGVATVPVRLGALAARACAVVTDEYPTSFLPRMVAAAAERVPVRLEVVDVLGLLPLRAAPRAFQTAFAFRRFLQRTLPAQLDRFPAAASLDRRGLAGGAAPAAVARRWLATLPARPRPAPTGSRP